MARIDWFPCDELDATFADASSSHVNCGFFDVPLDWADESVGSARLAVAIYPATKERWGTVFSNPGGPGDSGVKHILRFGSRFSEMMGGHYDMISWDPRGVGHTTPGPIQCFPSAEEYDSFWRDTFEDTGLDIIDSFANSTELSWFYSQQHILDSAWHEFGRRCHAMSGEALKYIGTTATVRDMVALADSLHPEVGEINYYGVSYGTLIGSIFVNMFPERVGKVVLDGCLDPLIRMTQPVHKALTIDATSIDQAFAGFTEKCASSGPSRCELALHEDDTGSHIMARIRHIIQRAHDIVATGESLPHGLDTAPFILGTSLQCQTCNVLPNSGTGVIANAMRQPSHWPRLSSELFNYWKLASVLPSAHVVDSMSSHNHRRLDLTSLSALSSQPRDVSSTGDTSFEMYAITCADSIDPGHTSVKDVFDEMVYATRDVSPMFALTLALGEPGLKCYAWPERAVERYTGPWNQTLRHQILIMGNRADPRTPFRNSKVLKDLLGDSAVLLEQDGFGHTTFSQHSSCTRNIVETYFFTGKLPETGYTLCSVDDKEIFPLLSSNAMMTDGDAPAHDVYRTLFVIALGLLLSASGLLALLMLNTGKDTKRRLPHSGIRRARNFV
ncbi:hypothetical protein VKT23_019499 [Stygiomarasmius scandens]|uniref:Hydrolase n=1 Tax=Marasmiellus scandens TaxID=2682957 RepID=A0ABR1ILG9_9AGAR